jgi:hypothetical protein
MNSRLPGRPRRALAPIVDQLDSRQLLSSLGLPVHGPIVVHHPEPPPHHPLAIVRFDRTAGSVLRTAQSTTAILD